MELFGKRLRETREDLTGPHLGKKESRSSKRRAMMRIVVSMAALTVGAYLVVFDPEGNNRAVGAGLIGTVVGYWLR